jgi:hypothetical protein
MPDPSATHRLSNGKAELIVSQATGRVVRFGPPGGPNLLWENPQARAVAGPMGGWLNWGGDKVWLWPQDDWGKWCQGNNGRPPGDPASESHQVEVAGLRLRMTSPVVPGYGVRVVREIELDAHGCGASFVNRVQQVGAASASRPIAPWTVTQVPAPRQVLARLLPDAMPPGYAPFPGCSWDQAQASGRIATMTRPGDRSVKMGLDADALAATVADLLFIVSTPAAGNDAGPFEPFRRAHVYCDPDQSAFKPASQAPYTELEFTAPLKTLTVGQSASLKIRWDFVLLRKDGPSAAEVLTRAAAPAGAPTR